MTSGAVWKVILRFAFPLLIGNLLQQLYNVTDSVIVGLEAKLAEMELGALFGLWVQSMFVGFTMWALAICIFIITYGRMIEIYLVTSVAPIPMATMANREWGQMGQNYLRGLFALGFQAFLIIICVAIYAILVRGIAVESDVSTAIWTCMGYTVLLCFTLFKTSSLARSIFPVSYTHLTLPTNSRV